MRVRSLQPDEWRMWREMRLRALEDAPDAFSTTFEESSRRPDSYWIESAAGANRSDRRFLVAEHGGSWVGMALVLVQDPGTSEAHLFGMWVAPEARRLGAGRALVAEVLEWSRLAGAARVLLDVTETNDAARRLYESFGFVETGVREPLRPGSNLETCELVLNLSQE